ncbi:MAG: arginine N-succinyltransferase [Candidatus Omnitrophica bacterium]|nr:arginine N-succinyltransferase [Candidatus Omnitrophota bacterium]
MLLIRQAGPRDFQGVIRLAKILDSYNLPNDPRYVRQLLKISQASFGGKLPKEKAKYLFVLEAVPGTEGTGYGKIVGCSLIIAKHGTPGKPHLWFSRDTVTFRSRTLGVKRAHQVLRLGFTEDGPTEVGGLVVLPGCRGRASRCGLQLSFVRFLYMAMHPDRFEPEVLAEYRGRMGQGGDSPFWRRVGHRFTGLSYKKADRLSVTNKEFILSLMPREPIYCALLPSSVRKAMGQLHPEAVRAAGLLKRIGFRPMNQIEPFDGGPYYAARRREISLIRRTRRVKVFLDGRGQGREAFFLAGTETKVGLRAVLTRGRLVHGRLGIPKDQMKLISLQPGEAAYVCPL